MNTAYPLWPISILIILFYSLSFAFSRIGLASKVNHRKFWNVLLLLAFLTAGLIGLLMVVKINYKLEIPFYEKLVGYHVSFGIGMAVIGFFHLWWHLNYYFQLFRSEKGSDFQQPVFMDNNLDARFLQLSAFLLGSTSIIAQVILLREFLTVFSGNELVFGLVLANWMILTGLGAYVGQFPLRIKKTYPVIVTSLLLLSVLPFATAFMINFLKNLVFPIGSMINVFQIFYSSLLLLIPFCLVSGFLFTFISKCYSEVKKQNETGSVYGFESVGSIVGGLLSGLLFIFVFSSIESLLVLAIINVLVLFLISLKKSTGKLAWAPLLVVIPAFILLFFHPENRIRSLVYPNQEVVVSKDSPHGNMVITRREELWSVYSNNVLLFDSENFMLNEEAVHFAMLQHPDPKKILLVSGGLSGQIAELKKYNPVLVDYVEDNHWLLTLMKDTLAKMTDESISVHATDPLRFIRNTAQNYDVAILNLPLPSTLQNNRFFTLEFFTLLKKRLSPGAVLSFGIQSPPNYLNQEAVDLNSTIYASLKKVFQNVIIIPGEQNYFLASDAALTYQIAERVQARGIENRYVNSYYIDDALLKMRGETILSALNPAAEINQNLRPVLYQQQLAYWLSQFKGKYWLMAALAGALALFVFLRGSTPSQVMFLTGFSASGLEILLLFGLQVFFGNIYLLTSFVFTGFMLGLAIGSFVGKFFTEKNYLLVTQLLIGGFAALIGISLFSSGMADLAPIVVYLLCLAATVLIGLFTGFQFAQVSQNRTGNYAEISGKTYSYDLVGSALGAFVVSVFLVPRLGIFESVLIIALANFVFGIGLILKR
jgi:spermidine synthase